MSGFDLDEDDPRNANVFFTRNSVVYSLIIWFDETRVLKICNSNSIQIVTKLKNKRFWKLFCPKKHRNNPQTHPQTKSYMLNESVFFVFDDQLPHWRRRSETSGYYPRTKNLLEKTNNLYSNQILVRLLCSNLCCFKFFFSTFEWWKKMWFNCTWMLSD